MPLTSRVAVLWLYTPWYLRCAFGARAVGWRWSRPRAPMAPQAWLMMGDPVTASGHGAAAAESPQAIHKLPVSFA